MFKKAEGSYAEGRRENCMKQEQGFTKPNIFAVSLTLDGSITVGFNHIKLPRIGWMKTYEVLPDNATPKSVT